MRDAENNEKLMPSGVGKSGGIWYNDLHTFFVLRIIVINIWEDWIHACKSDWKS